jgi:hypothetical protein
MMERIPDLPDRVVGIRASGQVTASDYEGVLVPAVEAGLAEHGKVRLLYQLGPAFTGFTPGAMWGDMKIGVAQINAWERIAVVTDVDWIAGATRLLGFAVPCPVRVFPNNEIAEATRWISAAHC